MSAIRISIAAALVAGVLALVACLVAGFFKGKGIADNALEARDKGFVELSSQIEGTLVRHTFIVENNSSKRIGLQSVTPDCGCTTPGNITDSALPGEVFKITLDLMVPPPVNALKAPFRRVAVAKFDNGETIDLVMVGSSIAQSVLQLLPETIRLEPDDGGLRSGNVLIRSSPKVIAQIPDMISINPGEERVITVEDDHLVDGNTLATGEQASYKLVKVVLRVDAASDDREIAQSAIKFEVKRVGGVKTLAVSSG